MIDVPDKSPVEFFAERQRRNAELSKLASELFNGGRGKRVGRAARCKDMVFRDCIEAAQWLAAVTGKPMDEYSFRNAIGKNRPIRGYFFSWEGD